MASPIANRRWNRIWRLLRWPLLVVVTLPVLWLVANWNDEAPSAAAIELSRPPAHGVADADNAWLYLLGIGAAEGEDPVALGRRQVDAFHARLNQGPAAAARRLAAEAPEDALPLQRPRSPQDSTSEYCPHRIVDCLDWSQAHAQTLLRLRTANAVRLQRVPALFALPQWDNVAANAEHTPYPDTGDVSLYFDLLAYDAALALDSGDEAKVADVLERMANAVSFLRRVQSRSQDWLSLMLSVALVSRQHRQLSSMLDRFEPGQIDAVQPAIAAILQAPATPVDWNESVRREYQYFVNVGVDLLTRTLTRDLPGCMDRGEPRCLGRRIVGVSYQPQATSNLAAENFRDWLAALSADARDFKLAHAQAQERVRQRTATFDGIGSSLRTVAHNPFGRILVAASLPNLDGTPVHDAEALRRSVLLKAEALRRGLEPDEIPAFLAAQPAALRNPWTGEPLSWDAHRRSVSFVPESSYARGLRQGSGYRPLPTSGLSACPRALRLRLREIRGEQRRAVHSVISCSLGNVAYAIPDEGASADRARYAEVRSISGDGRIDIDVLITDNGRLQRFAAHGIAGPGVDSWSLAPAEGRDNSRRIDVVSAQASTTPALVSIASRGLPAQQLLGQIAAATGLRIDGVPLAGNRRVSLMGDMPAADAIRRIAAASGLDVEARGEQEFRLRRGASGSAGTH